MMHVAFDASKSESGKRAAEKDALLINNAIRENGKAQVIMATGVSQFSMLEDLVRRDIDWGKVTAFILTNMSAYLRTIPRHFAGTCGSDMSQSCPPRLPLFIT